jgi:hypothetical protein
MQCAQMSVDVVHTNVARKLMVLYASHQFTAISTVQRQLSGSTSTMVALIVVPLMVTCS